MKNRGDSNNNEIHKIPRGFFAQYSLMKLHFCCVGLLKFEVALQLSVSACTFISLKIHHLAVLNLKLEEEQTEHTETVDRAHKT
jgi:hypothetical protein